MTNTLKIFVLITTTVAISYGCKVKDRKQEIAADPDLKKNSIAWLLAGDDYKAWSIQSFQVNGVDQLKNLEPCQLDNIDLYFRNLVYESTEGAAPCKAGDPDLRRRGKWSFNADSTAIEVKLGQELFSLSIVEITENKLHYRSKIKDQLTEAVLIRSDYQPVTTIQADTTN